MITIYHNPRCSNSRNALAMIIASGETPNIIQYLDTPPNHDVLRTIIDMLELSARELLRSKEPVYSELQLGEPSLSDDQLIDAMVKHPILLNRPIVITSKGARLCRPPERVLDLLKNPVIHFITENGEEVHYSPN